MPVKYGIPASQHNVAAGLHRGCGYLHGVFADVPRSFEQAVLHRSEGIHDFKVVIPRLVNIHVNHVTHAGHSARAGIARDNVVLEVRPRHFTPKQIPVQIQHHERICHLQILARADSVMRRVIGHAVCGLGPALGMEPELHCSRALARFENYVVVH